MPISINEFWKLAVASGLLTPARSKELHTQFAGMKGASRQANTLSLSEWLVSSGTLSRYQVAMLAAGRPGPFVFGDYVICDHIETGRLARVFQASQPGGEGVLLVFTAQLPGGAEWPEMIADHARAAMSINSPHVCHVQQFVPGPPHSFTVIQDLKGQSLREYLARQKLDLEAACRVGFHAALGLVAMHAQGVAHGKLCPENIWIDPSGTARLLQFPLATSATLPERLELPMVDYLAPELRNPEQAANESTDVYALGCTLYELIAGRVPFTGGNSKQKIERHRSEVPQRLDRLVSGLPEELADLVAEMIDKEPLLRSSTAGQVAHLLVPFAADWGSQRRPGPPKDGGLTPGYGAWKAPPWQAPPRQKPTAPRLVNPAKAEAAPREPAATQSPPTAADTSAARPAGAGARPEPDFDLVAFGLDSANRPPDGNASADSQPWDLARSAAQPGRDSASKSRARAVSTTVLVGGAVALALLAAIIVAGLLVSDGADRGVKTQPPLADGGGAEPAAAGYAPAPTESAEPPRAKSATKPAADQIDDDGQTLWVSPTAGKPIDLTYLPSGAQVFVVLRPAEILGSAEGAKVFDALGPAGETAMSQLRATLGVELSDIEQLVIAFYPDDAGLPEKAYVVRLRSEIPQATLLDTWGQPAPAEHKSRRFFQGADLAYYLPKAAGGRVAAIAEAAAMREIIERDEPPPMRKGLERLLRDSDDARHFNLLLAPSYLLTDGKSLLAGDLEKLRDPLAAFFDETIEAVLLSAHLGDALFLELRAVAALERRPNDLASRLQSRLEKVPENVERYVASLQPGPYGRLVVNRFPRMLQLLSDYTRGGVENQQAVLRCYLPGIAAHNLILGTQLILFEQPVSVGGGQARQEPSAPRDAAAALKKTISLSFPRDTLDRCMEMLAKEIGVDVVILGADLQLEGITKNQSFGLDERDQPAGEVLGKVLKLANPSGKLVYVIGPNDAGQQAIFITTRNAATKRGQRLPAEFEPKTPAQ